MEESKVSETHPPEHHKFKASHENIMVELPSSSSQFVMPGDMSNSQSIAQPVGQMQPLLVQMQQTQHVPIHQ